MSNNLAYFNFVSITTIDTSDQSIASSDVLENTNALSFVAKKLSGGTNENPVVNGMVLNDKVPSHTFPALGKKYDNIEYNDNGARLLIQIYK